MKIKSILLLIGFSIVVLYGASAFNDKQSEGQYNQQVAVFQQKSKRVTNFIGSLVDKATPKTLANIGVTEAEPAPPLVIAARKQIGVTTKYDPAYVSLKFPMGDVPMDRGVCTDVVVRAYRQQGKDLQVLVNSDMKQAWSKYPKIWGLKSTDKNIDHRRVPNLRTFFSRHGKSLGVSDNPADYKAGDLVTWDLSGRPHIGIVSNRSKNSVPFIIHNIGVGTQENDILFRFKITGHYRY
ncbi:MAG: DUF1287 domain-containing protein [Gammaproteobacteria bacterium]|nr:MAG: DUF1287 domain-containing protein [Gammaproteobacteria bacterium]